MSDEITPPKKRRLRTMEGWHEFMHEERARNPHQHLDAPDGLGRDFLFVENVAAMLACHVDFVRRIPRQELPASRRGQRLIYSRADVEAYILSGRDSGTGRYVPDRALGKRGATVSPADHAPAAFDPVAYIRTPTKSKT